ncbi:MAG TPA: hypothetical protein PKY56_11745 [Candidatus Kapabacteria bacterium]|nr:hypothetical protein [Candidatus Kapabacteria bacterium]
MNNLLSNNIETIEQEYNKIIKNFEGIVFKMIRKDNGYYYFVFCDGIIANHFELTTDNSYDKTINDLLSEEDASNLTKLLDESYSGKVVNAEFSMYDLIFLMRLVPDFEDGKIVGVIGSGIDITKLKLAHTELLLNEQHFSNEMSNIFNFLPEGIIVLSKELRLLRNNAAFKLIIDSYYDSLGFSKHQFVELILNKVITRIKDNDKNYLHFESNSENVNHTINELVLQFDFSEFSLNFQTDFIIVSLKDITEKYLIEKEKNRIFNEYIKTVSNLNVHILRFKLGDDGKYYVSFSEGKNVEELGLSTAFYYGKTFEDFAFDDYFLECKLYFDKAFKGETTEFFYSNKNRKVLVNVSPFESDKNGKVIEVLASATLITGRL